MMSPLSLTYGYDPLCGWCYGFAPVLRRFAQTHPDVSIDVVPGGLFTADRARPYAQLIGHIQRAQVHLKAVTGRAPSEAFHAMIAAPDGPVSESAVPAHAVLQMKQLAPARAVEYAHILQEMHYGEGLDLSQAETYRILSKRHGFPYIDTEAALRATHETPLVARAFTLAGTLGIRSYPSMLLTDTTGTVVATMESEYDPDAFAVQFDGIVANLR